MILLIVLVLRLMPINPPVVDHGDQCMCVTLYRRDARSCEIGQSNCADDLALYHVFCGKKAD